MYIPPLLKQISSPPKQLYYRGADIKILMEYPRVAIVGSRLMSSYGKQITNRLAAELASRGVVIISGLAYGVDAAAHRSAVEAGGKCIAVLPCPLDNILPAANIQLASDIVSSGGTLVSEYADGSEIFKTNFVARNRLVAGLADAVLITEATEKSGSLHTARFALEQGKEVLAVPGNITSSPSAGTNNLIKAGAVVVTDYTDVLRALNLTEKVKSRTKMPVGKNPEEQVIIDLVDRGTTDGLQLQHDSGLDPAVFSQTLTMLEISGKIHSLGGNQWSL